MIVISKEVAGVVLALGGGWVAVHLYFWVLRRFRPEVLKLPEGERESHVDPNKLPAWVTGFVERMLFLAFVIFGEGGIPTALIGWLALKAATNWNHSASLGSRQRAFAALLGGVISLGMAYLGEKIFLGQVPLPDIFFSN